jgi:hypothetical protein
MLMYSPRRPEHELRNFHSVFNLGKKRFPSLLDEPTNAWQGVVKI